MAGQLYIWIVRSYGSGLSRALGSCSVELTTGLRLQEFLAGRMRDISLLMRGRGLFRLQFLAAC